MHKLVWLIWMKRLLWVLLGIAVIYMTGRFSVAMHKEMQRIREDQALVCKDGFVKVEQRRRGSVCVQGYKP